MRKLRTAGLGKSLLLTAAAGCVALPAQAHHHAPGLGSVIAASVAHDAKPAATAPATAPKDNGAALVGAIKRAIAGESSFVDPEGLKLSLSSSGGNVSLVGSAATIYDRIRAVQVAEAIDGVHSVKPSIRIRPTAKIEPPELQAAIRKAMAEAGVLGQTFDVQVESGGIAHLNGDVTNEWRALEVVRRVPGVAAIGGYDATLPGALPPAAKGTLRVVGPTRAQDDAVAAAVREALKAAGHDTVGASVQGGIVTLSGRARGIADAMAAADVAGRLPGVLGITDKMTISGRAWHVGEPRADADIERDVRRAMGRIRGIERLEVRASQGRVYLTGRITAADAAYRAVETSANVGGVREVVNALTYPQRIRSSN